MAEYSSLKVPELKKLLAEKGLPQTGNKADLIARLQENDKKTESEAKPAENKEDEISYSDDEVPAEPAAPAAAAAPEPAPAAEEPATEAAPVATEGAEEPAAEKPAETEKPAEPEKSYAIGLSSTAADDEAKKRAERAKRFGLEEDEDAKKRADRAKRFGLDEKELASTLDSALPERSRKRGRDRGDGEGKAATENNRPGKRQSLDRRNDRRRGGRGGRGGARNESTRQTRSRGGILDDPAEKAKAEKRAARFAGN
ncbi:hypothetical protein CDV36_005855 [Fusarium kuroshium]|uniref:SAP domain-containing protein n=2 Tax=Fusarium solani species complex TaxID=232080 RepID=A0A3M2SAA0_9HYPO|nr:hypothetical protein CDV36_005855 [Fusarium kuroshium]RSM19034.1 hypothetical protein CDV31_002165 [Fusarium ambrosium]